ncbi:hypothetical protein [Prauserella cavernicola]|uniref:Uncharacterized protein n=1 Tax=Prauserella cavernicola TaxID=2800127 RepID=A0A934V3Q1_9PSEU|nr:hypothetical protein [Prauserella cavernicola]MBK1784602.1 hypothetical protein [Prauserella cavernicola]
MAETAAATTGRDGRVRRWLSRFALIAGGVAAAWAVSTASASASASEDLPQLDGSVVAEAAKGVGSALAPKQDAEPKKKEQGAALPLGDGEMAGKVKQSAEKLWQHGVAEPVGKTLDTVGRFVTVPEDRAEIGKEVWESLQPRGGANIVELPELGELPGLEGDGDSGTSAEPEHRVEAPSADTDTVGPVLSEVAKQDVAEVADAPVQSAPVDEPADTEADSRAPAAPIAPLPTPAAPAALPSPAGGTHFLHLDGPLLGIPAGGVTAFDKNVPASVRAGVVHTPTQPGEQPGVTPD